MKYLFVGDIHGKVEDVQLALKKGEDEGRLVIFMGDFIDSFTRSALDHAECFDLVINAIKTGKARSILGNHELSYLMGNPHRCSGYEYQRQKIMNLYKDDILKHFDPYILLAPDFLVTHAGLTKQIWDEFKMHEADLDTTLHNWYWDKTSPAHWIGRYRGGTAPVGGIFWCDWNAEFVEVPGLTQVFGHTAGKGIRQQGNSYCIDCLDRTTEFLSLDVDDE